MTKPTTGLDQAAQYLAEHDPRLAPIIAAAGSVVRLEPHQDYYSALVGEIIGQQLSVKAAAAIRQRFYDLFDGRLPTPEAIVQTPAEAMRAAGLSWAKAKYIRDLAEHMLDGKIDFGTFDSLSNEQIIAELVDVKGIGEWTAHMFLIFCMGRLDILPTGDLGIKSAIRKLYGFEALPTPQEIITLAEQNHWYPYESVASWYLWHSLDNKPAA